MGGLIGKAINDVLAEDNKGKAICKTCGASGPPWNHVPSVFDPMGKGNPGHKMDNPGLSSYSEDYYLRLEGKEEPIKKVNWNGQDCEIVEETEHLYAVEVEHRGITMVGRSITWIRKEWVGKMKEAKNGKK